MKDNHQFKKGDYVSCVYDDEEILGRIIEPVPNGYIVSLVITHYSNGQRLAQDVRIPEDKVKPIEIVVQDAMVYKRHKKDQASYESEK